MKKLFLIIISPILLVVFIIGLPIYYFSKNVSTLEFVFDVAEYLMG